MKRFFAFLLCLTALLLLDSCKKEPFLTLSGPASIDVNADGGSGSITFTSNTDWTASSSESWVSLSPSSGTASDGPITVTVKCNANTTYEDRSATVTLRGEGLTQSVTVRQPANLGVVLPNKSYDLTSDARTLDVEVQANVDYTVSVSEGWIKQTGTKGLTSKTLSFSVEENTTYDSRSATITVKPQTPGVQEQVISVKQAQKDALIVKDSSYDMPYGGGEVDVKVEANVSFEVKSGADWIQYVQTKALSSSTVVLKVAENTTYSAREGKVEISQKGGSLSHTVTIKQAGRVAVTGVTLNMTSMTLSPGESATLVATVKPDNATDKSVSWSSDNPGVATVDAGGKVTAVAAGSATITAKAGDKTATCTVTVEDMVAKERAALSAFYNATGGNNWTVKDNWCSDKPLRDWYGINTDDYGHVISILLGSNNLTGTIPGEIFSLSKLACLNLSYNNLTGPIPNEVGNAKELEEIHLQHNNLTGPIPETLYQLKKLFDIELWSNQLSGELSEKFWSMPALKELAIDDNKITGQLTSAVRNAKQLEWLGLGTNLLTGTIPKEITELTALRYFSLENHPISNGSFTETANQISGSIPGDLDKLQNLNYFLVENNNLEGGVPSCFAKIPQLACLELYGNRLSGEIPAEVVACSKWDSWAPDKNIMPQQQGYVLSFAHYESKDFSSDGKVIKLQSHEKGNGISIVITGDCFTDQDIAAGDFEKVARQTMEDFFGVEPFTTFRNLFDVYAVVAVSKTAYSNYGTALGAIFGEGSYVGCDEEKVRAYSSKAVSNLDETLTIVIVNKNSNSGTAFMPYPTINTDFGSGFAYACFGLQSQDAERRLLINHEANGHGFTKLQDEYYYTGFGGCSEDEKKYYKDAYFAKGYYANIDFESDPKKVKWAKFLADDRYKFDGLGVFEGGMTWEKGVWRPSENSIMNHQQVGHDGDRFNAPSRAAAYIRIHKLAYGSSWQFDYEEFVKYDAVNRKTSASSSSVRVPGSGVLAPVPHTPPVMIGKKP
ncbi:MAG: Ig-like domain-containing protein [Bacteroidales bacterium]|nr:Ig-like domain-containing protein [Bacteroidales bacterium]